MRPLRYRELLSLTSSFFPPLHDPYSLSFPRQPIPILSLFSLLFLPNTPSFSHSLSPSEALKARISLYLRQTTKASSNVVSNAVIGPPITQPIVRHYGNLLIDYDMEIGKIYATSLSQQLFDHDTDEDEDQDDDDR
jgi:hypothetical protein